MVKSLYRLTADSPDDGSSKHLWNVGQFLWDYKAQHPRKQLCSHALPREPEISKLPTEKAYSEEKPVSSNVKNI